MLLVREARLLVSSPVLIRRKRIPLGIRIPLSPNMVVDPILKRTLQRTDSPRFFYPRFQSVKSVLAGHERSKKITTLEYIYIYIYRGYIYR